MLEQSVKYIMLGFLYKFILAHIFGHLLLGHVKTYALYTGGFFNLGTLGVMYVLVWISSLTLPVIRCLR